MNKNDFFKGSFPLSLFKVLSLNSFQSMRESGFHFQEYWSFGAHPSRVTRAWVLLCLESSVIHMPKASITSAFFSFMKVSGSLEFVKLYETLPLPPQVIER